MKKRNVFLLLFLLLFLVSACTSPSSNRIEETGYAKMAISSEILQISSEDVQDISIQTLTEWTDTYQFTVSYPVMGQSRIDLLLEQKASATIQSFKDEVKTQYESLSAEEKENYIPSELNVFCNVYRYNKNIVSVAFVEKKVIPQKEVSVVSITPYLFNINENTELVLKDLFIEESNFEEILSTYADQQIKEKELLAAGYGNEHYKKGIAATEENYQLGLLTKEGLILVFEKEQLSEDLTQPQVSVLVPFEKIENILKKDGAFNPADQLQAPAIHQKDIPESTGKSSNKKIALTFNITPSNNGNEALLSTLAQNDVKATFYVLGIRGASAPQALVDVLSQGHSVGNMGYSGKNVNYLSKEQIQKEFDATNSLVENITGKKSTTIRAPYGIVNKELENIAKELQQPIVLWDIDTMDWHNSDPEFLANYVLEHAKDGSVILMHDLGEENVLAVKAVIDALKKEGFDFVTVEQLVENTKPGTVYMGASEAN